MTRAAVDGRGGVCQNRAVSSHHPNHRRSLMIAANYSVLSATRLI